MFQPRDAAEALAATVIWLLVGACGRFGDSSRDDDGAPFSDPPIAANAKPSGGAPDDTPEPSPPKPTDADQPRPEIPTPDRGDPDPTNEVGAVETRLPGIDELESLTPRVLAEPPWTHNAVSSVAIPNGPQPALKQLSKTKSGITDDDAWWRSLGAAMPVWEVPNEIMHTKGTLPPSVPTRYASRPIVLAEDLPDHAFFAYGKDFSGRYLAITNRKLEVLWFFDFGAWLTTPVMSAFSGQEVTWAEIVEGVLLISVGHRTYAADSDGKNAYVSAVSLETGELLWRSDPLVSNSRNFVVHDGWIITGYGFTAEPDFVYLIDARDGSTARRIKVESGPDYFVIKDGHLFVRTYDTDYEFSL